MPKGGANLMLMGILSVFQNPFMHKFYFMYACNSTSYFQGLIIWDKKCP